METPAVTSRAEDPTGTCFLRRGCWKSRPRKASIWNGKQQDIWKTIWKRTILKISFT